MYSPAAAAAICAAVVFIQYLEFCLKLFHFSLSEKPLNVRVKALIFSSAEDLCLAPVCDLGEVACTQQHSYVSLKV